MQNWFLILPIVFPIVVGFLLLAFNFESRRKREIYVAGGIIVSTILTLIAVWGLGGTLVMIPFSEKITFAVHVDNLTKVFASMSSILWIPATFWSLEYMKHEGMENKFFAFWLVSFGVTMGIAMAENPVTLYFFYECLTLATLPLVMHDMSGRARYAGKLYILYSMGGAALAFVSLMFLINYSDSISFVMGGFVNTEQLVGIANLAYLVFVLGFFGYGAKASIFPLHKWLPAASVAPTPVTALLHAVAVVKAGVFAVIRLTYYSFDPSFIYGSWGQTVVICFALFTILYGSWNALRMPHLKRRFALSTTSNLSYMLFGVALCTPMGLTGSMIHMVVHACVKITLFFTAGAIFYQTHNEYVYQVRGYGKKMPIVMACMTITGLGLTGCPPFAGFTSKWTLATAAVQTGLPMAYIGAGVLIVSAVLTTLYIFTVIFPAYFPGKEPLPAEEHPAHDPNKLMTIPLICLTLMTLAVALFANQLIGWFNTF